MKINQLIAKLQENWKVKIVCLVLAIVLYIFHQVYSIEKKSFIIPVTIIENGSVMHVETKKSTVTVTVRADVDTIGKVHPNDIVASINLDTIAKSGDYSVPINLVITPDLLSNDPFEVTVKPESIKVKVEKKGLKNIKVEPSIVGEPKHGYEISEITVEPPYVEVLGPESVLENTDKIITEPINISEVKNFLKTTTNCKEISNQLQIQNKGPYNVTVKIDASKLEKTFENVPIYAFGLSPSLKIKGNNPTVNITVTGTVPNLEEFELPKNAMQMDLSLIYEPGKYEVAVTGNLPPYLTLENQSKEVITIELEKNSNSIIHLPNLSVGD